MKPAAQLSLFATLTAVAQKAAPIRILSYGGGLDSWAMLLLAVNGELPKPDLVVFADVADGAPDRENQEPGEWPSTYRHVREVAMPLCAMHGIEFVWLTTAEYPVRPTKDNPAGCSSLYRYFADGQMFPASMSKVCTVASKVDRIGKYIEARFPQGGLEVWIGFGADEEARLKGNRYAQRGRRTERYPLMERGMCRCREEAYARQSGLPVPRKSACVFCPHSSRVDFQTLARELPEQFKACQALEDNFKGTKAGRMLTYSGKDEIKLAEYVAKPFDWRRARERQDCPVCGSKKATKRTGCDYLG